MQTVDVYESDFGTVRINGGVGLLGHDQLKRPVGRGRQRRTCRRSCIACRCKVEKALNAVLECAWLKGRLVSEIVVTG